MFLEKLNILKKKVLLEINNIFDHEALNTDSIIDNEMYHDAENKDNKKDYNIKNNNILKQIVKLQLNDKGYFIEVMCINNSIFRNNENSGFRYFIDLKDDTGSIRLIAFNKEEYSYYEQFKINEVFKIYDASVKQINTKFNPIGSKYELRFNKLNKIEFITNNNNKIRKEKINITAIGDIIN